ncbi:MAG: hypothetical protein IJU91_02445 [Selenomonadaceae bacterium]|nr:hypothetical protein [Selenomonadaceae bacterium]
MAVKALIFGIDDLFPAIKPFYEMAVQRGDIDIVGYAVFEPDGIKLYPARGGVRTLATLKLQLQLRNIFFTTE